MELEHLKGALMAVWILAVGALGYVSGAASFTGWSLIAVVALVPPALVLWFWRAPSPSMSETIRDVLR